MIELAAPAKINLGLAVVSRRNDGFHDIDTLMVKLDLSDRVRLEPLAAPEVRGAALPASDPFVAARAPAMDDANLALRAARAYLEAAGWPGGVRVSLGKSIPIAAGLGGGSSDAGAVLRLLARLYPSDLDLARLAIGLGSDVPFFAMTAGAARARGRGEQLEAAAVPDGHAVLVNPGVEVSAGSAYAWRSGAYGGADIDEILADLQADRSPLLRNDLQPGVRARVPEVAAALSALAATDLEGVLMSGSGATCFGLARDAADARSTAAVLAARHPDWWVRAVRFPRRESGTDAVFAPQS